MKSRHQRSLSVLAFSFFLGVGTYNAVVINSESQLGSDIKFVKRLDELYGVTRPGRLVAASVNWKKLAPAQVAKVKPQQQVVQEVRTVQAAPETISSEAASAPPVVAAVQEELNLNLIEVVNPKKWQQGLAAGQFTGTLATRQGTIENLNVTLPNGEGVSVSFSDMAGNVFEYDLNGEIYTGMMYQVDQNAYMITLSNGPLEGTRMKFIGEASPSQLAEQESAEVANMGTNSENDNYGQPSDEELAARYEPSPAPQPEFIQAQEATSDFQPAEVPIEQQPYETAYQGQQRVYTQEEAYNLDMQLQEQALQAQQGYNLEQPVN